MKTITVLATGSRGDVQPFIAMAYALANAGYRPRVVTNRIYASWVRSYQLEVYPVSWDPREAMRLQTRLGAEKNPIRYIRCQLENTRRVYSHVQRESWEGCKSTDRLIFSLLSPWGYSIAEKMGVPCIAGSLHPLEPTHAFPMQMIPINLGSPLNWASHELSEQLLQLISGRAINRFRQDLGLSSLHFPITLLGRMRREGIPLLCNLSPTVLPRPEDWPDRVHMEGYWFLPSPPDWKLPPELEDFLAKGSAPVYVGFGSLISEDPRITRSLVEETLTRVGRRGILLTGWGGFEDSHSISSQILQAADIPHGWLFERMAVIVHHGGAGTTAAALQSGIPQVIIPHMQDQPYWGKRMYELGVAPAPIHRKHLTTGNLAAAIWTAINDPDIRVRAQKIGQCIRSERGLEKTVQWIGDYFTC